MASNKLIIDDEYFRTMARYYVSQGEQLDSLTFDYIAILEDVKSKAISSGDVADALNAYISYVKKLNKKFSNISKSLQTQINQFLARVDSEDKYLF